MKCRVHLRVAESELDADPHQRWLVLTEAEAHTRAGAGDEALLTSGRKKLTLHPLSRHPSRGLRCVALRGRSQACAGRVSLSDASASYRAKRAR